VYHQAGQGIHRLNKNLNCWPSCVCQTFCQLCRLPRIILLHLNSAATPCTSRARVSQIGDNSVLALVVFAIRKGFGNWGKLQEPLQMNNQHKTFTKCNQHKHVATLNITFIRTPCTSEIHWINIIEHGLLYFVVIVSSWAGWFCMYVITACWLLIWILYFSCCLLSYTTSNQLYFSLSSLFAGCYTLLWQGN
jgi:hypothetical protein